MKTKISVDIHSDGSSLLMTIVDYIGKSNAGKVKVTLPFIEVVCEMKKMELPALFKDITTITHPDNTMSISIDGGTTYFCTLTWKETHELQPEKTSELEGDLLATKFVS